jgi:hypothetical protein
VSPLVPPSRTCCPASPSLPWGPWASVPHLPGLPRWPADPRYDAPRRLPRRRLDGLRGSRVRRYPGVILFFTPSEGTGPRHPAGLGGVLPRRPAPAMPKERRGAPQCPRAPAEDRPRSPTLVGSWALALARPGLRPAGAWKPSAVPSIPRRDSRWSTTLPLSGLHHAACPLAPPRSAPPCLVAHGGLAPDRRARRLSGGTCAIARSPPGSQQRVSGACPHSPRVALSWRDHALVRLPSSLLMAGQRDEMASMHGTR